MQPIDPRSKKNISKYREPWWPAECVLCCLDSCWDCWSFGKFDTTPIDLHRGVEHNTSFLSIFLFIWLLRSFLVGSCGLALIPKWRPLNANTIATVARVAAFLILSQIYEWNALLISEDWRVVITHIWLARTYLYSSSLTCYSPFFANRVIHRDIHPELCVTWLLAGVRKVSSVFWSNLSAFGCDNTFLGIITDVAQGVLKHFPLPSFILFIDLSVYYYNNWIWNLTN